MLAVALSAEGAEGDKGVAQCLAVRAAWLGYPKGTNSPDVVS